MRSGCVAARLFKSRWFTLTAVLRYLIVVVYVSPILDVSVCLQVSSSSMGPSTCHPPRISLGCLLQLAGSCVHFQLCPTCFPLDQLLFFDMRHAMFCTSTFTMQLREEFVEEGVCLATEALPTITRGVSMCVCALGHGPSLYSLWPCPIFVSVRHIDDLTMIVVAAGTNLNHQQRKFCLPFSKELGRPVACSCPQTLTT